MDPAEPPTAGPTFLPGIVVGVVQGLTEFLPISSTAHMRIVPALLGWEDPGAAFSAVLHLGTLAALLLYFRHDLVALAAGAMVGLRRRDLRHRDLRLVAGIAAGTVPLVAAALLLEDRIGGDFRSLWVVAGSLGFFGALLGLADRVAGTATRGEETIGFRDAVLVGLAQVLALVPGASRAGVTLTGAFLLGVHRTAAARFSFLLSIPAVAGAGLYELWRERDRLLAPEGLPAAAAGTLVAGAVAYLTIGWMLWFLRSHSAMVFVAYRVLLGAALAALLAAGVLDP